MEIRTVTCIWDITKVEYEKRLSKTEEQKKGNWKSELITEITKNRRQIQERQRSQEKKNLVKNFLRAIKRDKKQCYKDICKDIEGK